MHGFVQIIEFTTSRIDEVRALAESVSADRESGTALRGLMTADRDHPGRYLTIVEFASYDEAMENSERPQTKDFAAKMAELCDGPATFHNLDVQDLWLHPTRRPLGHESGPSGLSEEAEEDSVRSTRHEPGPAGEF
jgi:hypothetical protein